MKHIKILKDKLEHARKGFAIANADLARETPRLMGRLENLEKICRKRYTDIEKIELEINEYLEGGLK